MRKLSLLAGTVKEWVNVMHKEWLVSQYIYYWSQKFYCQHNFITKFRLSPTKKGKYCQKLYDLTIPCVKQRKSRVRWSALVRDNAASVPELCLTLRSLSPDEGSLWNTATVFTVIVIFTMLCWKVLSSCLLPKI